MNILKEDKNTTNAPRAWAKKSHFYLGKLRLPEGGLRAS